MAACDPKIEDSEDCAEISMTFVVPNFYQTFVREYAKVYSDLYRCNDLVWKIGVEREKSREISVLLYCHADEIDDEFTVYAEFTLRVVNTVNEDETREAKGNNEFEIGGQGCGYPGFGILEDLVAQGFVADNKMTVECFVACGVPVEIKLNEDSKGLLDRELHVLDVNALSTRGRYFLDSGIGSDCEFILTHDDGSEYSRKASQVILARASPVFEAMFFGSFVDESRVQVTDVDGDAFDLMLSYIYGADWRFTDRGHAVAVYYAADKYLLDELKSSCITYTWPSDVHASWVALDLAVKHDLPDMRQASMTLIQEYTNEALGLNDFLEISHGTLLVVLKQHYLNASSELVIFDAVLRWATHTCEQGGLEVCGSNLRVLIGDGMRHIRFLAMKITEFSTSPVESNILTDREVVLLFKCICNPYVAEPLYYFSALKETRGSKYDCVS